jgi:prepilin-type N-terminal cleavage/methylation domain-containing protein/prepilin-type processing-associated H-X9-DG protein
MPYLHPIGRRRGFTLVELLVVIGIIALLVGILLPTLSSARKSANATACAASLREVGNGFNLYGIAYDNTFPVARHMPNQDASNPRQDLRDFGTGERRWSDFIAQYIENDEIDDIEDIEKLRERSIFWGCPEWDGSTAYGASDFEDRVYTGYGMQYYPTGASFWGTGDLEMLATLTTGVAGKYHKMTTWGRDGAQKALVADAMRYQIYAPATFDYNADRTDPFHFTESLWSGNPFFQVDANRHNRDLEKRESMTERAMNMLFVDGHVEKVSVTEAYTAVRAPGYTDVSEVFAQGGTFTYQP